MALRRCSSHPDGRQELRRLARLGGLLERIGQLDQRGLAPGAAEERNADGHAEDEFCRDVDIGIAGDGGERGSATSVVVAVDVIGKSGRAGGGCDDRVEFVFVHRGVDSFGAREAMILRERVEVSLVGERAFRLRFLE